MSDTARPHEGTAFDERLAAMLLVESLCDDAVDLVRRGCTAEDVKRLVVARTGGDDRRALLREVRRHSLLRAASGGPDCTRTADVLGALLDDGLFVL